MSGLQLSLSNVETEVKAGRGPLPLKKGSLDMTVIKKYITTTILMGLSQLQPRGWGGGGGGGDLPGQATLAR